MKRQNLDRISSLHESIRRHILSFLPMKDAIRTSLLSKNWRHVCSSLPILDFDEQYYEQEKLIRGYVDEFKNVVDQVLIRHNESDITHFWLSLGTTTESLSISHLNSWISFAVQHNVQQLKLRSIYDQIEQLPSCLFSCSTLTTLYLNNVLLKLPATIRLPLLKSLKLCRIKFLDDKLTNKLFSSSSCPVLEELYIGDCYQDHANTHIFSFPNLKLLMLFNHMSDGPLKVNLFISHLHKFVYSGRRPPNLVTENLSSLSYAKFLLFPPTNSNEADPDFFDNSASKILMQLRNVETLGLTEFYIEFLTRDRDLATNLVTPCYSMTTLQLQMIPTENQVRAVTLLLKSYPNLQTLIISCSKDDCTSNKLNMEEYWQTKMLSTRDVLEHLKTVEVKLFQESEIALDLMQYLLANARALEKMSVVLFQPPLNVEKDRMELSEKLLTFTRVSPYAAIYVSRETCQY